MTTSTELATRSAESDPSLARPSSDRALRPVATARLRWWAAALATWSALYSLAHVYWAVGGEVGFSLLKPSATELDVWRQINAVAAVVLLIPVGIALGLATCRDRRVRGALLVATLLGASIAASHGIFGMVYRVLNITRTIEIDGRPFDFSKHPWVVWDLVLFEPWFLLEGFLFIGLGWASLASGRHRRGWLLACTAGVAAATVVGLLGVRVG